jgi:CRP/FNR family transcriptional regulator
MTEKVLEDIYLALRTNRMLRSASDEGLQRMAAAGALREFGKGERVCTEGEPADHFGIILSGTVPSYQLSADGHRFLFAIGERGDNIGIPPAIAGGRYSFCFEASGKSTIAWFPRASIFDLVEAEPAVGRDLMIMLADWLTSTMRTNRILTLDVPSRVASYLFGRSLADGVSTPEGLSVALGIYKADLASYLNTVPETLSRAFATLTAEGLITVHGRTVIIHDVKGLAHRGEGLLGK